MIRLVPSQPVQSDTGTVTPLPVSECAGLSGTCAQGATLLDGVTTMVSKAQRNAAARAQDDQGAPVASQAIGANNPPPDIKAMIHDGITALEKAGRDKNKADHYLTFGTMQQHEADMRIGRHVWNLQRGENGWQSPLVNAKLRTTYTNRILEVADIKAPNADTRPPHSGPTKFDPEWQASQKEYRARKMAVSRAVEFCAALEVLGVGIDLFVQTPGSKFRGLFQVAPHALLGPNDTLVEGSELANDASDPTFHVPVDGTGYLINAFVEWQVGRGENEGKQVARRNLRTVFASRDYLVTVATERVKDVIRSAVAAENAANKEADPDAKELADPFATEPSNKTGAGQGKPAAAATESPLGVEDVVPMLAKAIELDNKDANDPENGETPEPPYVDDFDEAFWQAWERSVRYMNAVMSRGKRPLETQERAAA